MLFRSADAMKSYISGVILFDETLRQKAVDGTPLVDVIKAAGAVPGIKLDKGPKPLPFYPGETVTEGLDGLAERVAEYAKLGAEFAKWRAVIDVSDTIPSYNAINANAHALARYAAICQQGGIVPMVEPEVLMDGAHTIDRCMEATEWALKETFQQLYYAGVKLEGIILKPNMVISGKKCATQASREEVAEKTLKVLKRCVPAAVPGIAFLSGGQSSEDATAHLHYMNAAGPLPWKLTFSYGRALAGRCAEGLGRQAGERGRRPACLRPPRQDERPCRVRPLERAAGEGGLTPAPLSRRTGGHRPSHLVIDCLKAACEAGDVASLLVPAAMAKDVTAPAQALGVAVMVSGEARDAARNGADGVQVEATAEDVAAAREAHGQGPLRRRLCRRLAPFRHGGGGSRCRLYRLRPEWRHGRRRADRQLVVGHDGNSLRRLRAGRARWRSTYCCRRSRTSSARPTRCGPTPKRRAAS